MTETATDDEIKAIEKKVLEEQKAKEEQYKKEVEEKIRKEAEEKKRMEEEIKKRQELENKAKQLEEEKKKLEEVVKLQAEQKEKEIQELKSKIGSSKQIVTPFGNDNNSNTLPNLNDKETLKEIDDASKEAFFDMINNRK